MKNYQPNLEIRIYGIDGSTQTFIQNNPALANRTLRELHPALLFSQDQIVIADEDSQTMLFPPLVARVDLFTDRLSALDFPSVLGPLTELTGAEFMERFHVQKRHPVPTNEAAVLLSLEMAGGQHVFLWTRFIGGMTTARMDRILRELKDRRLIFSLRRGGIGVLNLFNLVRFSVHPKPPASEIAADPSPRAHTRTGFSEAHHRPHPA